MRASAQHGSGRSGGVRAINVQTEFDARRIDTSSRVYKPSDLAAAYRSLKNRNLNMGVMYSMDLGWHFWLACWGHSGGGYRRVPLLRDGAQLTGFLTLGDTWTRVQKVKTSLLRLVAPPRSQFVRVTVKIVN